MNVDYGIEQVRVATFDNEPLARLWQQRLQAEDIPCVLKSLGVGSGAWGGNSFVPHGLYVFSRDRQRAVVVIRGADSQECLQNSGEGVEDIGVREGREPNLGGFLLAAAFTILVLAILSAIRTMLK